MSKTSVLILMGPPGSGKGTQAKLMASKNPGWLHISTGDLFRAEIASASPLGLSVKDTISAGNLVTDDVTNQIFESQVVKLLKNQPNLLILDGYPRTGPQASFLVGFCTKLQSQLNPPYVIEFEIPLQVVIDRLANRLVNARTGRVYHRITNPPKVEGKCDEDGSTLIQRPDDQPETIKSRFKIYTDQRDQIVKALGQGTSLEKISAQDKAENVEKALETMIRTHQ